MNRALSADSPKEQWANSRAITPSPLWLTSSIWGWTIRFVSQLGGVVSFLLSEYGDC